MSLTEPLNHLDVAAEIMDEIELKGMSLLQVLEQIEAAVVTVAMARANGNKSRAARILCMNRTTLVERLKRRKAA